MYDKLARRAITAAITHDWTNALNINFEILLVSPEDINALNRASRALIELGEISKAHELAQKALTVDPLNTIASKCVTKCKALHEFPQLNRRIPKKATQYFDQLFLEEPGRTKIVSLINLCEDHLLALINTGESVALNPGLHKVSIVTEYDMYIGRLPDDVATRIIYLTKNGNKFSTFIKSVTTKDVSVFIREFERSKDMESEVSFPVRF